MAEPRLQTAPRAVSVSVTVTIPSGHLCVHELEAAVLEATRAAGRQLYLKAFAAAQEAWLAQHPNRFSAQRWRTLHWLTPFGPIRLPVRVVRDKTSGRYLTSRRSSSVPRPPACSPPTSNKKPAPPLPNETIGPPTAPSAAGSAPDSATGWSGPPSSSTAPAAWWNGKKPHRPPPTPPQCQPSSAKWTPPWLQAQQRRRQGPVRHFPVPLGLHYTGRARRYQARGSTSLRLIGKHLCISTAPLAQFGAAFGRLAQRLFRHAFHLLLSQGDQGLQQLRQRLFPQAHWLLDRWHLTQALRAFTGPDQAEFQRLLQPLRQADAQAALEALAQSPLRHLRPKEFQTLWGYLQNYRHGIDAWHQIPATLRRRRGRTPPPVKSGSGAVEKNIEVHINRRFKRQGRSGHPLRA